MSSIEINGDEGDSSILIIQDIWWNTKRQGNLLVGESDKKELITYPALAAWSALPRNIHRGLAVYGEKAARSGHTEQGRLSISEYSYWKALIGWHQIFITFQKPLLSYSAKSFTYYQVCQESMRQKEIQFPFPSSLPLFIQSLR